MRGLGKSGVRMIERAGGKGEAGDKEVRMIERAGVRKWG